MIPVQKHGSSNTRPVSPNLQHIEYQSAGWTGPTSQQSQSPSLHSPQLLRTGRPSASVDSTGSGTSKVSPSSTPPAGTVATTRWPSSSASNEYPPGSLRGLRTERYGS